MPEFKFSEAQLRALIEKAYASGMGGRWGEHYVKQVAANYADDCINKLLSEMMTEDRP